ncbi:MAG: alpha-ketoacid dehydrogenase subunit beta [Planctomycetes bacterium]|nr:alpha-ketoacid dehydrogenase subunit beta [Planctomycetota bacterium]
MPALNMVEALNLALHQEMQRDETVTVLGEDVAVDEGVFRVTAGLWRRFGERRVIDTPVSEVGILGCGIGMAINGLRPICEVQFSGFLYQGFHQLEEHASRMRNRSRGGYQVPMVVRAPYGGGVRALEHHSESRETYYVHTPGLKVVIPSRPRMARALLISAIRDPDPVVFLEPKRAYRAFREEVPEAEEAWPLGKSEVVRQGSDVTLVSYGACMMEARKAAESAAQQGVSCEVIDLLTLSPLDSETFLASVKRTGRCVVVHEAARTLGMGAELAAQVSEEILLHLQAPVVRVTGYDVPPPYPAREKAYYPTVERILGAIQHVMEF